MYRDRALDLLDDVRESRMGSWFQGVGTIAFPEHARDEEMERISSSAF
jgi:hypothetical protein